MVKVVRRSKRKVTRSTRKVRVVRHSKRKVTRLTGAIEWDGEPGRIVTAIIREGGTPEPHEHDVAIRCTYENEKTYEIGLDHIEDDFYRGSYGASLGNEKWTGGVQCSVLRAHGAFCLQGKWGEKGEIYSWTAELTPVVSTKAKAPRRRRDR